MSNAPARVTVTYRVQVTEIFYLPKKAKSTHLLKHKYKSLSYAQGKATVLTHKEHDENGKLVRESKAVVISHPASTPLH